MSASEREHDLIWKRLDKIEEKVDQLLDFRGWVLGAVAAIATGVSTCIAVVAAWWSRP